MKKSLFIAIIVTAIISFIYPTINESSKTELNQTYAVATSSDPVWP